MRSPQDVQKVLATRWDRSVPVWLDAPADAEVSVPLHPPSAAEALSDPARVSAWIAQWQAAPPHLGEHVHWETRRWSQLGTQRLPVRWSAQGAGLLCRCAGGSSLREWELLSARYEAAVSALAGASPHGSKELRREVAAAVNRVRAQWLRIPEVDADLAIRASAWFLAHPESGLRIRQVPQPGMHTKWLQQHRSLVGRLVAAARADGSPELGLAPVPVFHDLLVLDPALRRTPVGPGFPRASRLDLSALAGTGLAPRAVIICENSETVQVLPDLPGAVALSGAGYAVPGLLAVPWVQEVPVIYWGDLDADGFRILDRARHHHRDVRSALMDRTTLESFRLLAVAAEARPVVATSRLTAAELALHEELSVTGERLEQERIELSIAVSALRAAVDEALREGPTPVAG